MTLKSTKSGYGRFTQILHWINTLFVIGLFYTGISLEKITDEIAKAGYLRIHIGVGLILTALVIIRIIWYFVDVTPEPPSEMFSLRLMAFKAAHLFLYLGLLALVGSGIWILFASGIGLSFADISSDMIANNLPPVAAHGVVAIALLLIVLIHIAGVLSYQIFKGDVLHRMGISWFKHDS